jgi:hypothetical protein
MRSGLGLAAVAAVLAGGMALSVPALADEQTKGADTHLVLPDQPAGDDELQQASGAPPQAPAADGSTAMPTTATLPTVQPPPQLQGGASTSLGVNISTTSISTLSATVSNNQFHN